MSYLRRSTKAASDIARNAYMQEQGSKETSQAQSDRYNGALIRKDERLARLLKAYSHCSESGKDELVRLAEIAASAPGGII
jgi:hypothetical protein